MMASFVAAMVQIVRRAGETGDMVDADACAEYGDPGLTVMNAAFLDLLSWFEAGELDDGIAPDKYASVAPAFEEAFGMMGAMAEELAEVVEAELELMSILNLYVYS